MSRVVTEVIVALQKELIRLTRELGALRERVDKLEAAAKPARRRKA